MCQYVSSGNHLMPCTFVVAHHNGILTPLVTNPLEVFRPRSCNQCYIHPDSAVDSAVEHNVEKVHHRTEELVQGIAVVDLVENCILPLEDHAKETKEEARHIQNCSQGMREARRLPVRSRLLALPYCLRRHRKEG